MMKAKFTIGLFFLFCLNASGQILNYFKDIASPQAALVDRYGNYPVDFSTGLVDISIPLYTIKTTSLTIPLQLKFHASGLRADEREGLFGIRWALFGGGQITREIKGYPDELYPFNSNANNPNQDPNFYDLFGTTSGMILDGGLNGSYNYLFTGGGYFEDTNNHSIPFAAGNYQDTEYDIFSYTLPSGKSGKFIVQGTTGIPMPFEPIQIQVVRNDPNPIKDITIIDENGDTYRFGGSGSYYDTNDNKWPTTWHLSTIISANRQDTVQMDYIQPETRTTFCNSSLIITDELHDQDCFEPGGYCSLYETCAKWLVDPYYYFDQEDCEYGKFTDASINSIVSYTPFSISSIRFNEGGSIGRVNFSYINDKNGTQIYLNKMTVSDAQNNTIKQIKFDLNNNASGNLTLLDSIEFLDNASAHKYYYSFNYYDSPYAPACDSLMLNCDWWGYYSAGAGAFKDESNVNVLSVDNYGNQINSSQHITGGDKHSDVSSMEIGMLKTITYPTGGQANFNYEANTYSGGACGGLRIAGITTISNSGKSETKSYDYANASIMPCYLYPPTHPYENCNYGFNMFTNFFTENEVDCFAAVTATAVVSDGPVALLGNSVSGGKYIKRTFMTTVPSRYTDFNSNIVYYPTVTETTENSSGQSGNGKTVYQYNITIPDNSFFDALDGNSFVGYSNNNDGIGYQHVYVSPTDFWKTTRLTSKTIYKGGGTQKVKEYLYSDTTYYPHQPIYDLPVFRYRTHWMNIIDGYYINNNEQEEIALIYPIENNYNALSQTFAFKHQKYTIGADKLSKETEITYYDNGDSSTVVKKITYDPTYLFPISESVTNSNGDVIRTDKQYPFSLSSGVYPAMVSNNILSDVVQANKSKNNNFVESTTLNYQQFYNNYLPGSIVRTDNTGASDPLVDQMQFNSNGNPQYMLKNGSTKIVYLWSYNSQNRIAKIEGLTYDQVVGAVGSDLINSLAAAASPTRDQIEQIRTQINSSGLTAMVTTYSYVPLIGMVTATDHKGVTTTYTYDNFNRLQDIINDDSNVLNDYKYHFSTQQ